MSWFGFKYILSVKWRNEGMRGGKALKYPRRKLVSRDPDSEMAEEGYERRKGLEIPSEEACEQRSRQ